MEPVQKIFTWLRRTEEEQAVFSPGKNCQNTAWGKTAKSRPNSSHSALDRDVLSVMHCNQLHSSVVVEGWTVGGGGVVEKSGGVEFCNLSTYGGGAIVDPSIRQAEVEKC